jgi:hypothetical protein
VNRVGPGLYEDDDGVLHMSIPELLDAYGIADTPENREVMIAAAREVLANKFPDARVSETD